MRITRISEQPDENEALPGDQAPEGRKVLIHNGKRLGMGWYPAIKAPRPGCIGPRWKIFDFPSAGNARHAPSDFEPELFMEIL